MHIEKIKNQLKYYFFCVKSQNRFIFMQKAHERVNKECEFDKKRDKTEVK